MSESSAFPPSAYRSPQRSSHADRREAAERRLSATEAFLARLDSALHSLEGDPSLLQAAARGLVGVASRSPGADLMVSVGPDHGLALRLRNLDGDLRAELVRTQVDGSPPVVVDLTPDPRATVSSLASLLWSGQLGSSSGAPDLHQPHPHQPHPQQQEAGPS